MSEQLRAVTGSQAGGEPQAGQSSAAAGGRAIRVLIATGGAPHSRPAVILGGDLADEPESAITILMVIREENRRPVAERVLADAVASLAGNPSRIETKIRVGDPAEEIVRELMAGGYDLLVMGERPAHRLMARVRGTIRERVMGHISTAVVIAKGTPRPIRRILVCDSGAQTPSALSHFTARFADLLREDIEVTVLHVMSQISAGPQISSDQLAADAEALIRDHSPEGEWLERDIEVLGRSHAQSRAKIRHGLVVDEILAEAQYGDYDLVVIGAHRGEGWQRFLLTDVAREIIVRLDRPVLVVH